MKTEPSPVDRTAHVIAAGDPSSAEAGARILARGGNAVDAAVAATVAAWVAEPVLTAPFGGGFAMVAGGGEEPAAYDFFADVPGRGLVPVREQEGLDFRGIEVSFGPANQVFHVGRGSVAASRLLPGLVDLHRDRGALPIATVVEPAVALAEDGVPLTAGMAPILEILKPILLLDPVTENLFAPHGKMLGVGERFVNPELAALLRDVGAGLRQLPNDALLSAFGPPSGRLTGADLDALCAHRTEPLRVQAAGYEFLLPPPPGSGGLLVAFALKLLATVPEAVWQDEAESFCHLLACMAVSVEARRAALDLSSGGGPEQITQTFLADSFIDSWREPLAREVHDGPASGGIDDTSLGSTTHVSVVDAHGMSCAITSSNGEGCGFLVPGTGAMANNFLGEEDLHPSGFHSRPAGARLSSMMCPTAVLRDGKTVLTLGTGGSNRIRTAILQVLVNHLLRGQPIELAVQSPRIHYEGDTLYVEARGPGAAMAPATLAALRARVADTIVFDAPNIYFGGVHVAAADGTGAGDPRRGGEVRSFDCAGAEGGRIE